MLERVTIADNDFDLGDIAESIVYYGKVDLTATSGSFVKLINLIGIDETIRLAESENFTFLYNRTVPAVFSDTGRLYPHVFSGITLQSSEDGRRIDSVESELRTTLSRSFGKGTIPYAKIRRLSNAMVVREDASSVIMRGAFDDAKDRNLLSEMIRGLLSVLVPEYPKTNTTIASIEASGDSFLMESNIDFSLANNIYEKYVPKSHSSITPAFLLSHIAEMRWEMFYAGGQLSDVWIRPAQSTIFQIKVNSFSKRMQLAKGRIDRFEEMALLGRSFKKSVNSGGVSISEILNFVESKETRKFKQWITSSSPDADLLREYDKANATQSHLMSSLPARFVKFVVFSTGGALLDKAIGGSGIIGAAGGFAADWTLNSAEEMLSAQLKMGWKPNQWVNNSAAPFLDSR